MTLPSYNAAGTLGLNDTANRGTQPGEMGSRLPLVELGAGLRATALAAGGQHVGTVDGTAVRWHYPVCISSV